MVDVIDGTALHLFLDNRKAPARVKCDIKDIVSHGDRWEKVFSIDSVAITIRNFSLPFAMNGMLVWDDRRGVSAVQRLLGDELCSIMEICPDDVEWLRQHGASDVRPWCRQVGWELHS